MLKWRLCDGLFLLFCFWRRCRARVRPLPTDAIPSGTVWCFQTGPASMAGRPRWKRRGCQRSVGRPRRPIISSATVLGPRRGPPLSGARHRRKPPIAVGKKSSAWSGLTGRAARAIQWRGASGCANNGVTSRPICAGSAASIQSRSEPCSRFHFSRRCLKRQRWKVGSC